MTTVYNNPALANSTTTLTLVFGHAYAGRNKRGGDAVLFNHYLNKGDLAAGKDGTRHIAMLHATSKGGSFLSGAASYYIVEGVVYNARDKVEGLAVKTDLRLNLPAEAAATIHKAALAIPTYIKGDDGGEEGEIRSGVQMHVVLDNTNKDTFGQITAGVSNYKLLWEQVVSISFLTKSDASYVQYKGDTCVARLNGSEVVKALFKPMNKPVETRRIEDKDVASYLRSQFAGQSMVTSRVTKMHIAPTLTPAAPVVGTISTEIDLNDPAVEM